MRDARSWSRILVALIFSIAIVVSAVISAKTVVRVKNRDEMIRVTGSARKLIKSDLIIWGGTISYRAPDMATAYKGLKHGMESLRAYLRKQGLPDTEIIDTPISTRALYEPLPKEQQSAYAYGMENVFRKTVAFELSQGIKVRSTRVDLVEKASRGATELIGGGVVFNSQQPEYLYTKLSELKVEILAAAAKDARTRAEQIAVNAGCRLGAVRFARMGVMRITPAYTTVELDEYGTYDTSTLDKEITAIVTAGFAIQ